MYANLYDQLRYRPRFCGLTRKFARRYHWHFWLSTGADNHGSTRIHTNKLLPYCIRAYSCPFVFKMKAQFPTEQTEAGEFQRQEDVFREWISDDGSTPYAVAADRYHLYVSLACPWASRTIIF